MGPRRRITVSSSHWSVQRIGFQSPWQPCRGVVFEEYKWKLSKYHKTLQHRQNGWRWDRMTPSAHIEIIGLALWNTVFSFIKKLAMVKLTSKTQLSHLLNLIRWSGCERVTIGRKTRFVSGNFTIPPSAAMQAVPEHVDFWKTKRKRSDTNRNVKRAKWQHKQRHKKVRLHSDWGPT